MHQCDLNLNEPEFEITKCCFSCAVRYFHLFPQQLNIPLTSALFSRSQCNNQSYWCQHSDIQYYWNQFQVALIWRAFLDSLWDWMACCVLTLPELKFRQSCDAIQWLSLNLHPLIFCFSDYCLQLFKSTDWSWLKTTDYQQQGCINKERSIPFPLLSSISMSQIGGHTNRKMFTQSVFFPPNIQSCIIISNKGDPLY